MKKSAQLLFFVISGVFLSYCSSTRATSTLFSSSYDNSKDQTIVMIFPFGEVTIPGKWTKTTYNNSSRQYFFKSPDAVIFAVALSPWDSYSFYKPGMNPAEYIKAYYNWDSNFLQQQTKGQLKIIKEDKENGFLIWNLKKDPGLDSYFLFGLRKKIVCSLYVTTDTWDEQGQVIFLEKIYSGGIK